MSVRQHISSAIIHFINFNRAVSRWEKSLAERVAGRKNGNREFRERVLPSLLKPGMRILDVGGGKKPQIDLATKDRLGLYVVGVDVSADELAQAPPGAYDRVLVGDIASLALPGSFDLIVSRSVLEHVENVRGAILNLSGALADDGVMAHCLPCRNAPFAVVNRLLGNRFSRAVLFSLQPHKSKTSGFAAYYNECTPARLRLACEQSGLTVLEVKPYFASEFCSFFAPLYTLELTRQLLCKWLHIDAFSETFVLIAERTADSAFTREASSRHAR